jgi:hypothetical protein
MILIIIQFSATIKNEVRVDQHGVQCKAVPVHLGMKQKEREGETENR